MLQRHATCVQPNGQLVELHQELKEVHELSFVVLGQSPVFFLDLQSPLVLDCFAAFALLLE